MAEVLTLADIVGVHGIKGWLKIKPYLEQPGTLTQLEGLRLVPGRSRRPADTPKDVRVVSCRAQGKGIVIQIAGLEDRTAAEALRGWRLEIDADRFPEAGDDGYYWRDLIGLQVWCLEAGNETLLGDVDHLIDTGANDVLVVRPSDESIDDQERLIPWLIDKVVTRVDLDAREIWVDWFVDD